MKTLKVTRAELRETFRNGYLHAEARGARPKRFKAYKAIPVRFLTRGRATKKEIAAILVFVSACYGIKPKVVKL